MLRKSLNVLLFWMKLIGQDKLFPASCWRQRLCSGHQHLRLSNRHRRCKRRQRRRRRRRQRGCSLAVRR